MSRYRKRPAHRLFEFKENDFFWMESAKCTDADTNQFFPYINARHNGMSLATQKQVHKTIDTYCAVCPVARRCLEYGIDTNSEGIFGGVLLSERIMQSSSKREKMRKALTYIDKDNERRLKERIELIK